MDKAQGIGEILGTDVETERLRDKANEAFGLKRTHQTSSTKNKHAGENSKLARSAVFAPNRHKNWFKVKFFFVEKHIFSYFLILSLMVKTSFSTLIPQWFNNEF